MRTFAFTSIIAVAAAFSSTAKTASTGVAASFEQKQANYCQDLCDETTGCTGSYCKDNGLCFGLYHKGHSQCFQPSDPQGCDDSVLEPVSCNGYPTTTCQDVCNDLTSCKDSKWGSYCKSWQSPQVCFGIITKADGSLCFASVDANCEGAPYACPTATTGAPTTSGAITTSGPTTSGAVTTTSSAVTTSSGAVTTTSASTTAAATTTTVAATTTVATTTAAATTTTAKPAGLEGKFCGTTALGPFDVSFTNGKTVLNIMGQTFTADYALNGTAVTFSNYDAKLAALLKQYGATLSATYAGGDSIDIEIAPLLKMTAKRC